MRDDFKLIIDKIASDGILSSEIIRLQDKFCTNSLFYLTNIRNDIKKLIIAKMPHVSAESAEDVADFLSGLNALKIKAKVSYIKNKLPHFSKWFVNTMSTNNIVELFDIEQKLNTAHSNLCDELIKDGKIKELDGNPEDAESTCGKTVNKLRIFDALKSIHCKSNRTISDTVKKYFEVEDITNLDKVLEGYGTGTSDGQ
jgi:hypothetical protein